MSEQLKLFETNQNVWVQRVWKSIDPRCRSEVIGVLAQMGKALLQAETIAKRRPRKEGIDES